MIVTHAKTTTQTVVLDLQDAPTTDSNHGRLPATQLQITYKQHDDQPPTSDLIVMFGNVHGHYPQRSYLAVTEQIRPRPAWTHALIAEHAPTWWSTTEQEVTDHGRH